MSSHMQFIYRDLLVQGQYSRRLMQLTASKKPWALLMMCLSSTKSSMFLLRVSVLVLISFTSFSSSSKRDSRSIISWGSGASTKPTGVGCRPTRSNSLERKPNRTTEFGVTNCLMVQLCISLTRTKPASVAIITTSCSKQAAVWIS